MKNAEVAARLEEMADLLEAKDVEYKPRAYRRAAENLRGHPTPVEEQAAEGAEAVQTVEGVGEAIADKVVEYVETGSIAELEDLREELPVEMSALTRVEGVGPKTVGTLYEALGIRTLDDLETAAENGEIREVSGFGEKTEQNILDKIDFARQATERQRIGDARPLADDVLSLLRDHEATQRCEVAGSLRRWRETIGDVDVLVASDDSEAVVDAFVDWSRADEVIEAGSIKASVRTEGVRVDLRVVVPEEFGSALQYFTGSKEHNVRLRNYAIERDMKLNEYGAFDVSEVRSASESRTESDGTEDDADQRAGDRVAGETEAGMYEALGLPLIPPELREDRGEIRAAAEGDLPDLVERGDVRGDLHTHTNWSDGGNTIREMAAAAAEMGYDYHCVTDHATGPGMVGGVGVSDEELREQMAEIREIADEVAVDLFAGVEANIDAEGGISVDDDVLADLDLVVASPHSALDQGTEAATERLVTAIEHPSVDVLGHPSGRMINKRPGIDFDVPTVVEAAAAEGVALEINSNPARLDLRDGAVKAAVDAGATIAVNTDAHVPAEFALIRYGVHTARRGWAETADVLNARGPAELREFLH
ncbi:DNA polymerase/3'-5' exonuclease PolX [Halostella sp. JP-L12]|uniref:DNA polymerase/3'-5' exonuclease PolX n=1 Tax=Halostella TaxID=1843185 RepID=UPI000EF78478|nr:MULTISPECIES: DNA polymerase/3'-5' exonuclease PolX [Halostella]NHN47424.1 DNA polymerase/3'-5' exonuclease PolX [Halostella sp. JP-L12]